MDRFPNTSAVLDPAPVAANRKGATIDAKCTVIICKNSRSVCSYCHIKIKMQDLMFMTRSQRADNDAMTTPCFYGYHCDCFFLSPKACKDHSEIAGLHSIPKYHRQYICRKMLNNGAPVIGLNQPTIPKNLHIGYSHLTHLNRGLHYYCEKCSIEITDRDLAIVGYGDSVSSVNSVNRKESDYIVVYHPRCLSEDVQRTPITLKGFNKLTPFYQTEMRKLFMLFFPDEKPVRPRALNNPLVTKTANLNRDMFYWPRPQNQAQSNPYRERPFRQKAPPEVSDQVWNTLKAIQPNNPSPSSSSGSRDTHVTSSGSRDTHVTSERVPNPRPKPSPRPIFKPNLDHSTNTSTSPRKRTESTTSNDSSSSKIELKKSVIRSEITKILYKYNHDYITSKIVRNMLMKKFGCDLTPHKKFIDDTIMELLDIIDNNPVNLRSIPGRIFVEEGDINEATLFRGSEDPDNEDGTTLTSPLPMSADIDDISPFAIMGNQVDDIVLSNVDNTMMGSASNKAWGDKSNSPTDKSKIKPPAKSVPTSNDVGDRTYAISVDDRPINLCECCLCCFRIQAPEEVVSLYNHIQIKHKNERKCTVCNISYADLYELMLHVAEFHRGNKSFRCKNCKKNFNYHAELSKHLDFCFQSSEEDEEEEEEDSPIKSPKKKRPRIDKFPALVNTLKNTQDTLNKISTFIHSESFTQDI